MAAQTTKFPKLGPGVLKFGETASAREFSARLSSVKYSPTIKDEDPVPLLDGSEFVPSGEISGELSGTLYQDFDKNGIVAWTYAHADEIMPYTFIPNNAEQMTLKGKVKIKPVAIGGEVKKENTTDFTFATVGGLPEISYGNLPS